MHHDVSVGTHILNCTIKSLSVCQTPAQTNGGGGIPKYNRDPQQKSFALNYLLDSVTFRVVVESVFQRKIRQINVSVWIPYLNLIDYTKFSIFISKSWNAEWRRKVSALRRLLLLFFPRMLQTQTLPCGNPEGTHNYIVFMREAHYKSWCCLTLTVRGCQLSTMGGYNFHRPQPNPNTLPLSFIPTGIVMKVRCSSQGCIWIWPWS